MIEPFCTCARYGQMDLLRIWRARAQPIVKRLITRGRETDPARMVETVRLIMMLERGEPEVTAEANYPRSHHLLECPASIRHLCTAARFVTSCHESGSGV